MVLLPPANEVWGKVIFLHLFVILFRGGRAWPGGHWGVCVAGGHVWQGGVHGRDGGHAWSGGMRDWGGMCGWGGVCGRGGHAWQRRACMAGGHAWLGACWGVCMARGACVVKGGVCGKGGHAWQRGACVAKGGMLAKGGMHGKGGHVWWRGHAWRKGREACMVCMPQGPLLRDMAGQYVGGTHPTGMHSCLLCF